MAPKSNYDKYPRFNVRGLAGECSVGWSEILEGLKSHVNFDRSIVCVECYPGTFERAICNNLEDTLAPSAIIFTPHLLRSAPEIDTMLQSVLGEDPVFGRMNGTKLEQFFDERKLTNGSNRAAAWKKGLLLVVGTGATLVSSQPDLLVYADLARWELQRRQRQNRIANLGADNIGESASMKYKRAFFVDWRAADTLNKELLPKLHFLLDTNSDVPKMITGGALREALFQVAHSPFRVVPYFDPGPWGGHWMEQVCDLPRDAPNHAWCFDCVPEKIVSFSDSEQASSRYLPSTSHFFTRMNCSVKKFIRDSEQSSPSASIFSTP